MVRSGCGRQKAGEPCRGLRGAWGVISVCWWHRLRTSVAMTLSHILTCSRTMPVWWFAKTAAKKSLSGGYGFDTWQLQKDRDKSTVRVQVRGPLSSNSGELVRDWCLDGRGIMLRSLWDIAPQLASGELVRVLPAYSCPTQTFTGSPPTGLIRPGVSGYSSISWQINFQKSRGRSSRRRSVQRRLRRSRPRRSHDEAHAQRGKRRTRHRDHGDRLAKQGPGHQRGRWRHKVEQAGDGSCRATLNQKVEQ